MALLRLHKKSGLPSPPLRRDATAECLNCGAKFAREHFDHLPDDALPYRDEYGDARCRTCGVGLKRNPPSKREIVPRVGLVLTVLALSASVIGLQPDLKKRKVVSTLGFYATHPL